MIGDKSYTIRFNRSAKTYTIRVYQRGRLLHKYRSFPQGVNFVDDGCWTERDILRFLIDSCDYVRVF